MVVKSKIDFERALFYAGILAGLERAEEILAEIGSYLPRDKWKYFEAVKESFDMIIEREIIVDIHRSLTACIFKTMHEEKMDVMHCIHYFLKDNKAKIEKKQGFATKQKS